VESIEGSGPFFSAKTEQDEDEAEDEAEEREEDQEDADQGRRETFAP
jgi:hypothetical protein